MFSPMIGENHFYPWFVIWSVGENYHKWLKKTTVKVVLEKMIF